MLWAGLRWWLDELRGMVPTRVKTALDGRAAPLSLQVDNNALQVREASAQLVATLPLDGPRMLPEGLAERVAEASSIVLVLPDASVLRRVIDLPLSAEGELRAAISFEIDRQTPFSADQVHCRYRIRDRDRARKLLHVELAVAPRTRIETAMEAAGSFGIVPTAVRIEGDDFLPPFEFLPQGQGLAVRHWLDEPWRPILAAAVLVLLLGSAGLAWQRHGEAGSLAAEVAARREIGHRAQALRDEIKASETAAAFLPEKRQAPRAIDIIDTLTRLLPDDAWVFDLELGTQEARIEGFSTDVPKVIEQLQKAPIFETPQLRSPVAHSQANSRDRFDLALPLKQAAP
jgi:general secretion pathway protein L